MVSVKRPKPAFTADYEAPEAPPRRGRPPTPTSSSSSKPPRVEDSLGKFLQNPPPLLHQRGRKWHLNSMSQTKDFNPECFIIQWVFLSLASASSLRPLCWGGVMWKTMPGRLKQVPQDSTEWDRTDTGHCTDGHIDIDSCSESSSNKL